MPKRCSCNGRLETLAPEELARANFYSLLSRLFYAPPDAALQTPQRRLAHEARFFKRWIAPAAQPLCDAIAKRQRNNFYESVAHFAEAFFELERCAFEMPAAGTPRRLGASDESDTSLSYRPRH